MDELLAVIIFGAYSAFILNLDIEGKINLKSSLLEFVVLSALFFTAGYFGFTGLIKLDIFKIILSIGSLFIMKGFKIWYTKIKQKQKMVDNIILK